jgi:type IV pilus assembly protein PilY1
MNQAIFEPSPPRFALRRVLWAGVFAAFSAFPARALAQADVMPAPPNVLLLVDTSGSMDYKTNSTQFPACRYAGATTTAAVSERSRWIDLVEVLTGSINNYDCQRLDRNSAAFRSEFALNASNPYDYLYANPYHRPVSSGCVPGPGAVDAGNPSAFPAGAIKFHPFDNTAASCAFQQASDGILDSYLPEVRFGLMTFDSEPKPAKDVTGLWSYYVGGSKQGAPAGCEIPQDQEVGARNPSAPPWEGRAVGFGNPALGSSDFKSRNAMIQQILLATRPYGATPIAGMLDDARSYFLTDDTADPLDGSFKFGPRSDPSKDCRKRSIVLLSDGQPNMDLRPFCKPNGCPYDRAEDIAQSLKEKGIEIFVIGFALSKVTVNGVQRSCSSFTAADFDESNAAGICGQNPNDGPIQACCALNRIAAAGGHTPTSATDPDWRRARFADNRDELRNALSQAIGGSFPSTTRTPFVPASGSGFVSTRSDLDFARAYRFSASFDPGKLDKPWIGALNRGRYVCQPDLNNVLRPVLLPPDPNKGDKFVDNVNKDGPSKRKIFSVVGAAPVDSSASMRPNLNGTVLDGVGTYSGTMNATPLDSAGFVSATSAAAIKVTDTTCDGTNVDLTKEACRDRYLKWLVGLDNGTPYHRCPELGEKCALIAEIYHSIPRPVPGRPSQFLVDESYQKFTKDQIAANRPSVLYASSNDGFLHAFKMGQVDKANASEEMKVNSLATNELWTFIPPAVLPGIPAFYPGSHQLLLDGTPAIKEVVATENALAPTYKFLLERSPNDASKGTGSWRTILVQSFGSQRPGYFALDVTDPVPVGNKGPKFLWQLVTDAAGNQLFGSGGGTPLITTVFIGGKEVAVAVLPGGYGSPGTNGAINQDGCTRSGTLSDAFFDQVPKPRTSIPCYSGTAVLARSITIVRLDSGQILRTFRQAESEVPGLVGKNVTTVAKIDSPMTGQPVAFPADVGAVADRVFIGDQDGALWRLNFASKDGKPSDWQVELFFDAFPGGSGYGYDWKKGQPIVNSPIISVNDIGHLTVAFSTGDQEVIGAQAGLANYVWSLTELPTSDRKTLKPKLNWHLDFTTSAGLSGDRVIGEMALFNGDLYFSTVGPTPNALACDSGSGKVWGMHYLEPNKAAEGKGGRPAASLKDLLGTGGYIEASTLLGTEPKAFLSGATVSQQPTCESPGAIDDDSSFANYGVVRGGAVTPGKYQLIIPTGDRPSNSTKPGVTPIVQDKAYAVAVDLPSPPVMNYVDSWAAIVE